MNLEEPFRIHQVDFKKIVYSRIKKNETKKIIFLKYNDSKVEKPLVIQIPTLLNLNEAIKISDEYYELEVPLITKEKEKVPSLVNFFEELDKKIIQDAKNNSKVWFEGILMTNSIKYKKIIKESDVYKDGVIKVKIIKNPEFETLLQIEKERRLSIKEIPTNSWCKMLIEIYAVVINYQNNTFSLFLRPIVLSFKEKEVSNYNYKFLEDSESEKEDIDIPDSEINNLFIKNVFYEEKSVVDDVTSSNINIPSQIKIPDVLTSSTESSTSSKNESSDSSEEYNSADESDNTEELEELLKKNLDNLCKSNPSNSPTNTPLENLTNTPLENLTNTNSAISTLNNSPVADEKDN